MTPWKIRKNYVFYTSNPSPQKPSILRCLPYIANATHRNAMEHGRGEG